MKFHALGTPKLFPLFFICSVLLATRKQSVTFIGDTAADHIQKKWHHLEIFNGLLFGGNQRTLLFLKPLPEMTQSQLP